MSCKVSHCRYSITHVTKGHRCGLCGLFGHGQAECGDKKKIDSLKSFFNEKISNNQQCAVKHCEYRELHNTDAHLCEICKSLHTEEKCKFIKLPKMIIKCPICREESKEYSKVFGINQECQICLENSIEISLKCGHTILCEECTMKIAGTDNSLFKYQEATEKMSQKDGKIYVNIYGGMGSLIFFRRRSKKDRIESFFLHSDNRGQYGEDTDHRPHLRRFVNGYTQVY
jgi:hypothetical protein